MKLFNFYPYLHSQISVAHFFLDIEIVNIMKFWHVSPYFYLYE